MKTFKRDNKEYIILALNTENDEFVFQHAGIKPLKEFVGSYKGEQERSYMVEHTNDAYSLARAFKQHSIMKLSPLENGRRNVKIIELDTGDTLLTGELVNIGQKQPTSDAWTYDIVNNSYYIIK